MESLAEQWSDVKSQMALNIPFSLDEHTLVVFRVGSHSHGTYISPENPNGIDDVDLMVIVMTPPQYKLGLQKFDNFTYKHGKYDVIVYDYEKWMSLLLKQNPNVIGTLYLDAKDVYHPNDSYYYNIMQNLFTHRAKIVSKKMAYAFMGYAEAQAYKMTHQATQGYMGEKRKILVDKYGYDVKNGAHMIRLLRMCLELLETGHMNVMRPDAEEIKSIKQGAWSKERVLFEGGLLITQIKNALETTTLRSTPDTWFIDQMIINGYLNDWNS